MKLKEVLSFNVTFNVTVQFWFLPADVKAYQPVTIQWNNSSILKLQFMTTPKLLTAIKIELNCKPVTFYLNHYALEHGCRNFDLFFQDICHYMLDSKVHTLSETLEILALSLLYCNSSFSFLYEKYFLI